ncbi:MAG: rhodanese-like domain-containing protein [Saprospiraceae bacterium]
MHIQRFYDKGLAHASYVVQSENQIIVVDPARNPQPYYDYAKENKGTIVGVIETHPHADFVSSHLEISQTTEAVIYVSEKVGADYSHQPFDGGSKIALGKIELQALDTPGHSPDSISIVVTDEDGKQRAVFTGDTLFIGDVGRPDLRENAGNMQAKREELARQMYHSTREVLMKLDPQVIVYPAHGAGSLCGKGMSDELSSTLKEQLEDNAALQPMSEDEFVAWLLEGQPFIPKYFGYAVDVNKAGVANYADSIAAVPRLDSQPKQPLSDGFIVDTRPAADFKEGHHAGAINIMAGNKFETWLGSIIDPKERFYLVGTDSEAIETAIQKAAKIGYAVHMLGGFVFDGAERESQMSGLDLEDFKIHKTNYTIVDIRNQSEVADGKFFDHAINIPLPELRERAEEIPTDKPVIVHCAGGYRSAAGSSIVDSIIGDRTEVYDLSDAVNEFK